MGRSRQWKRSYLFLVRLWAGGTSNGETAWRGKVQQPASAEVFYFNSLPELADLLRSMMPAAEGRASREETGVTDTSDANG